MKTTIPLCFSILFSFSFPLQADDSLQCLSVGSDPDGDGFGFEAGRVGDGAYRYQSCIVTNDSAGSPEIINPATSVPVSLVRAYWNANRDIANKTIVCEFNEFNSTQNIHIASPRSEYTHKSLPYSPPFTADVDGFSNLPSGPPEIWTLVNGQYNGPMFSSYWFEVVTRDGQDAVREWNGQHYVECYDKSGAAFSPSGFPEEELPLDDSEPLDWVVTIGSSQEQPEPIVNLETGTEVQMQRVYWSMRNDIIDRTIQCDTYQWSQLPATGNFIYTSDSSQANRYYFHPIASDSLPTGRITKRFGFSSGTSSKRDWTIEGDNLIGVEPFGPYVELVDGKVRTWLSNESYTECKGNGSVSNADLFDDIDGSSGLIPTGTSPAATNTSEPEENNTTSDPNDQSTMNPMDGDSSNANGDPIAVNSSNSSDGGGGSGGFSLLILLTLLWSRARPSLSYIRK